MEALAHWWNNWASQQNIIVVVCGLAASWMLQHVVSAKGGLLNKNDWLRVSETQQYKIWCGYADEFSITKDYAQKSRTKREGLKAVTKSKKMVYITFVTSYGVLDNTPKMDLVDNDFTIGIFFG